MKRSRLEWVNLGLVVAAFALAAGLYGALPDPVPTHWNVRGEADGFMAKPLGAFLLPLAMGAILVLMRLLPRISPRGFELDRSRGAYQAIQTSILGFLFLITAVALLAGSGVGVPVERVVPVGVGVLFMVLGALMAKVRRNFFVGIRTPWTLASDEVWARTHELGGKLFVVAGLVLLVSGLLGGGLAPLIVAVLIAAGIPAAYSYFAYRKLERGRS